MTTLSFFPSKPAAVIRAAVRVLKRGGVIAFPTETTYGLGCDPRSARAVSSIFKIKGRDQKKALLLVASSVADVKKVAEHAGPSKKLAARHWPGPLTLVLPARASARLAKGVASKKDIAVRVSSSLFVRALVRAYGFPIIATSANRAGEPDCRSGQAVTRVFSSQAHKPDLILDGGRLPHRAPSTVARVHTDGRVDVLRRGAVRLPKTI